MLAKTTLAKKPLVKKSLAKQPLAKQLIETYFRVTETAKQPGQRRDADGQPVCFYCGTPLNDQNRSIDHIMPQARGGVHCGFNKVEACGHCNTVKNSRHPIIWFIDKLEDLPDELVLEYVARFIYHELVTEKVPEAAFITQHTEGIKVY